MEDKEYGGYIEFEYYHGTEYHSQAKALNSGRHGLEYLIRSKKIKKLYLPLFLCNSIFDICKKNNVEIVEYRISQDFKPILNFEIDKTEWLYLVNYYGQLTNYEILQYKKRYTNLIVDNIQAFFQKPVLGVDTIYTCRKFFGVPDGGYLYTESELDDLEYDYSFDRMFFLLGRLEKSANDFYANYVNNNKMFNTMDVKKMSKSTKNILRSINYNDVINCRNQNYKILYDEFYNINELKLDFTEGPFMYPLLISEGFKIRKKLQQEKIYVPMLWPEVLEKCDENSIEYYYANNILPLPIDQRYGIKDMKNIINKIRLYI